jgi:glyoxylase-like metal-dependent hydrolase (beta-lactamase superfamily II)
LSSANKGAPRKPASPKHERNFDSPAGQLVELSPLVRRMVAGNAGPFTFTGTCTYVVGRGDVAIIDPGPDDPAHVAALLDSLRSESVSHIVITHTHRDHSPAARAVAAATGAMIVGCAPHHAARELGQGETNRLDASADHDYAPQRLMLDGDVLEGGMPGGMRWSLEALATPGHTANHLAFALKEEAALFSGDHVMAWSTSIVAPPDGSMADYMASLEKLRGREDVLYWPGHGGPVRQPQRYLRALVHHRRQREQSILTRVVAGDRSISAIVAAVYEGLDPRLTGAAALSVFAHLEDMATRGLVRCVGGSVRLDGVFEPV